MQKVLRLYQVDVKGIRVGYIGAFTMTEARRAAVEYMYASDRIPLNMRVRISGRDLEARKEA